jgi:hypothetical protein
MTDQPSQRPDSQRPEPQWPGSSPGNATQANGTPGNATPSDGTPPVPPSGFEPPRFVPPYGSDAPAAPSSYQPAYGQPGYTPPAYGHNDQFGNQYSQYGQPASPYAQPPGGYGQPAYYGVPAEPKTLSIASMVCGIASVIMGWLLLPQIAAIITGHMALRREPSGRGMSITGLVLGYLCLLGYGFFWLLAIIGLAVAGSTATSGTF